MKRIGLILLISLLFTGKSLATAVDCDNAMTTLEINHCGAMDLASAQAKLDQYFNASLEHNAYDAQVVQAIKSAQQVWQDYRASHCGAVYTQWREGSIRGIMHLECQIELTEQRTFELWTYFLRYMDSTPPVLPDPRTH